MNSGAVESTIAAIEQAFEEDRLITADRLAEEAASRFPDCATASTGTLDYLINRAKRALNAANN